MKSELYIDGLGSSTNPELGLLKAKLPLERGKTYSHDEIAAACETPYRKGGRFNDRYGTIVHRWIRWAEKELNIVLVSERAIGYRALLEGEKIDVASDRHKKQHKQYKKTVGMLAKADLDDPIKIAERDHRLRLMIAVNDAMKKTTTGFKLTVFSGNPRPLPPTD